MGLGLKKKIDESITAKIFVVFNLLIFLISVVFSTLAATYQQRALISNLKKNGELLTTSLAHSCRIGAFTENIGLLSAPIEGVATIDDVIEVSIFNSKGNPLIQKFGKSWKDGLITSSPPDKAGSADFPFDSWTVDTVKQREEKDRIMFWSAVMPGSDFGVSSLFLEDQDSLRPAMVPLGYIRISISKASVKKELTALLVKDGMICLGFLFLGAFITYLLTTRITRPLKRLTQRVSRIGEESFFQQLPVESGNEIGMLTVAFNRMLVLLKDYLKREIDHASELTHARNLATLGTAAGKVTHEVGNLLNNIGLAILLLKKESLSERGLKALTILGKESDRIHQFIRNFLQFAKKIELYPEEKPLSHILEDLKEVNQDVARQRRVEIVIDHSNVTKPVIVDHRLLYQALNNLVKNAVEAIGDEGGRVTVTAETRHDSIEFTVSDTGTGMADSVREKLFEPFFTTKGKGGTGLGMAITKSIVEAHGGTIECVSKKEEGARFRIQIPLLNPLVKPSSDT